MALGRAHTSHPVQLDAVETKAFKIIGISPRDEDESMGLSLHHHRQVGGPSVFYFLLSGLALSVLSALCPPQVFVGHINSSQAFFCFCQQWGPPGSPTKEPPFIELATEGGS